MIQAGTRYSGGANSGRADASLPRSRWLYAERISAAVNFDRAVD